MKTIVPFGESPTDELVKRWLEVKLINPEDVMAYRITRGHGGIPTIELTMHYSEEKAEQD